MKILCDADMFMFMSAAAVEQEVCFGDTWHLFSSLADAKRHMTDKLNYHIESALRAAHYNGDFEVIMCISDDNNFRKEVLPEYKMNRAGKRKPVCYRGLVDWVKEEFEWKQWANLEADDVMGILSTQNPTKSIILSGDKDMRSIPGYMYNFIKEEFYVTSEQEADYKFLYQTLIGDTTDNYKGCPGMGDKTATKLLDATCTWEAVLAAYEKKGLTLEDAMQQARVARILRTGEYNVHTGEVCLWTPSNK